MLPYLRNVKHSKTMPRPSQLFVVISVNLRLLVAQNCLLKVIGSLMNELTTWKNINIPICKCQRYFLSLSFFFLWNFFGFLFCLVRVIWDLRNIKLGVRRYLCTQTRDFYNVNEFEHSFSNLFVPLNFGHS